MSILYLKYVELYVEQSIFYRNSRKYRLLLIFSLTAAEVMFIFYLGIGHYPPSTIALVTNISQSDGGIFQIIVN